MTAPKTILVAVDGSAPSMHAARMALDLAKATGATLTVAYALAPVILPGEVPFTVVNEVIQADTARGKQILDDVLKDLAGERVTSRRWPSRKGSIPSSSEAAGATRLRASSSARSPTAHICKKPVLVVR